jgi:cytochrome P450
MKRIFSRAEVAKHRERAHARACHMLQALPVGRSLDAIEDLALPFTLRVLSDLLGVHEAHSGRLREFTERAIMLADSYPARLADILAADEITPPAAEVLQAAIARAPEETLAGALRQLVAAQAITPMEAVANLGIAFAAGHDTTISLIARILHLLTERPAIGVEALAREGGVVRFVEEAMRYFSPVQLAARVAAEGLDVRGRRIEKGADVMVLIGAANRDPGAFSDPDAFRLDRLAQPRSLGFGFGVHLCVGEQLARLHAEVFAETVLREFPDVACRHDGVSWRSTATFRFPRSVEVTRRAPAPAH